MTHSHPIIGRLGLALALSFATAGAATIVAATAADAMPLIQTVDTGSDGAQIIQVAGGCGIGEHRGPYGGCRLNRGPLGALRAATSGVPGGCPPGMHRGYYGHCRY